MSDKTKMVSVLSVDAWGNADDGFDWNTWYKVGTAPVEVCDRKPEEIIAWMIDEGYCTELARTKAKVEDDQYNMVICDEDSRPLFAIAYGEVES